MLLRPVITLTTDFGYADPFVGVMKGVMAGICPEASVIDITHGIRSHDIAGAAYALGTNYRYFPEGTVHVAVVDPGVGSDRRPILAVTDRYMFVGPDNGIFSLVYKQEKSSLRVFHITSDRYLLKKTSSTFQGRDLFAPVAAWLAKGEASESFGAVISDYKVLDLPIVKNKCLSLTGEIISIDKFGNCITNISEADIYALTENLNISSLKAAINGREIMFADCYSSAENNGLHCLINSSDRLEIFVYMSSAANEASISVGDALELCLIQ